VSAYRYLLLGVIVVALVILVRVALSVLNRLGRLLAQAQDLKGHAAEIQEMEGRIALLDERMADIRRHLATSQPGAG
jgi:cell division protein FtsB